MKVKPDKMELRFHKSGTCMWLVFVFLIIDARFFYLINLPPIFGGAASNKFMESIISVIIFIIYLIVIKKFQFSKGKFCNWIVAIFMILMINAVHSFRLYGYPLTTVVWPCIPFAIFLMYFPLKEWLRIKQNYKCFIKMGEIISSILAVLFIVQVFIYRGLDTVFLALDGAISDRYIYTPSLGLRIYSVFDGFIRVFILLVAYRIIEHNFKKCFGDIISFILMLLAILLVDQSRFYLATLLTCFAVMFLMENRKRLKLRSFVILLFAGIAVLLMAFKSVVSILNTILMNDGSFDARIKAIIYFLKTVHNHIICGMGIVVPGGGEYYYYITGPEGMYHYDDVGVIGVLASLGIIGFLWYIGITMKFIRICWKDLKYNALVAGIVTGFVLSIFTMSYLDKSRIVSFMLALTVLDIELWKKNIGR